MTCDQIKQGVYAPDYYNNFRCTADKCKHSCCIDWEICIDEKTLSKYKKIESISTTITECDDGFCFELDKNGRCPHLNKSGLCNIIITNGEDYLSEICRNHPRFFNYVSDGRIEAGLGIVCEEACRLIIENEKPFFLSKIKELDNDILTFEEFSCEFDVLPIRDRIVSLIEDFKGNLDEKIKALQSEFVIHETYTIDEWIDRFLSFEILDTEWSQLLKSIKNTELQKNIGSNLYDKYYERLLVYFIYRHVSVAKNFNNLRARLSFAILSVKMIRYLFDRENEQSLKKLIEIARSYSAEIEYSEDNTFEIMFNMEYSLKFLKA